MASDPNSPRHRALSYISDSRFHHRFSLPATADHDSLNVTYAVAGHTSESPQRIPTILFMPGMFASRYMAVQMHAIAAKLGVRVLVVDR